MNNKEKVIKFYEKYIIIVGSIGSLLPYIQAYEIFIQKTSKAVSLVGFIMSLLGLVSWFVYGVLLRNKPLIIVNIFAVVGVCLTLVAILFYR